MSDLGEALRGVLNDPVPEPARRAARQHPSGFEPGAHLIGRDGTVTVATTEPVEPLWDGVFTRFGLDPKRYMIEEPVEMRSWDSLASQGKGQPNKVVQLFYWKIRVRGRSIMSDGADIDQLIEAIRKHKPAKKAPPTGDKDWWAFLSDWQIGKEGTEETVQRITQLPDLIRHRVSDLRKIGHSIESIYLAGMGDVCERCYGSYPQQLYTTVLNHREQRKVSRRLILKTIQAAAPLAQNIVVPAVPGNHGEERSDGKSVTDFGDNMDTEVFEQVADILAENPDAYGHVKFVIPRTQLSLSLHSAGRIIGLAHGHAASGASAVVAIDKWWKGQQMGRRAVGDADILVTAHRHHFMARQNPRPWFQCPTLDNGSQWFEETNGAGSVPGTLSFLVTPEGPHGWDELKIL